MPKFHLMFSCRNCTFQQSLHISKLDEIWLHCKVAIYYEEFSHIKLYDSGFVRSCDIKILYISIYTRPMGTNYGKVVTSRKGIQPVNWHNPLNICSYDITWLIKNVMSPLSQSLWSQLLSGWLHTTRSSHPWSSDKLNALSLHLQKTHGHQLQSRS